MYRKVKMKQIIKRVTDSHGENNNILANFLRMKRIPELNYEADKS